MSAPDLRTALARYLAQRRDLSLPGFVLDSITPERAMELAATVPPPTPAARPLSGASPTPATPAPGPARVAPPPGAAAVAAPVDAAAAGSAPRTELDVLRTEVAGCTLCGLQETRTQTVFSDGQENARVMVVGEAPGANEDRTGLPFVGAAGKLLDLLLASVGLSRADSVYICNVLKCRPPGNRDPSPAEIQHCSPYLKRQIQLVAPEVILAVGSFSARLLTGQKSPLSKLRGEVHSYQGVPMLVTYHPAAILRNPGWTRPTWDDLQLLRDVLDGAGGRP